MSQQQTGSIIRPAQRVSFYIIVNGNDGTPGPRRRTKDQDADDTVLATECEKPLRVAALLQPPVTPQCVPRHGRNPKTLERRKEDLVVLLSTGRACLHVPGSHRGVPDSGVEQSIDGSFEGAAGGIRSEGVGV